MNEIPVDKGDVEVVRFKALLCNHCGRSAAHYDVILDLRNAGQIVAIGRGLCRRCARSLAERVKESLPDEKKSA